MTTRTVEKSGPSLQAILSNFSIILIFKSTRKFQEKNELLNRVSKVHLSCQTQTWKAIWT